MTEYVSSRSLITSRTCRILRRESTPFRCFVRTRPSATTVSSLNAYWLQKHLFSYIPVLKIKPLYDIFCNDLRAYLLQIAKLWQVMWPMIGDRGDWRFLSEAEKNVLAQSGYRASHIPCTPILFTSNYQQLIWQELWDNL